MIFGTVCSGIGAPEAAWRPLGWRCAFMSEIEAFPRAVLAHHYADVPLHGDFTTIQSGQYEPIELLCGGTPCQSFSVAGLRGGMADERGNLALEFLRLADRLRPRWMVWENVPGVLSSNGGRDFGAFLGGLGELGYGFAYRCLDAQHFGLAQRRLRVFVVGYLGDWRPAAAVLFEPASLRGDPPPRREAGQSVAPTVARGSPGGRTYGLDADTADSLIAGTLNASGKAAGSATQQDAEAGLLVAHAIQAGALRENVDSGPDGIGVQRDLAYTLEARAEVQAVAFNILGTPATNGARATDLHTALRARAPGGSEASTTTVIAAFGGNNTSGPIDVATALNASHTASGRQDFETETFITHTLRPEGYDASEDGTGRGVPLVPIGFDSRQDPVSGPIAGALSSSSPQAQAVASMAAVRRRTPTECERLMGFSDGYSLVPYRKGWAKDGPRYRALGNSMAVPVVRWIGRRIEKIDAQMRAHKEQSA